MAGARTHYIYHLESVQGVKARSSSTSSKHFRRSSSWRRQWWLSNIMYTAAAATVITITSRQWVIEKAKGGCQDWHGGLIGIFYRKYHNHGYHNKWSDDNRTGMTTTMSNLCWRTKWRANGNCVHPPETLHTREEVTSPQATTVTFPLMLRTTADATKPHRGLTNSYVYSASTNHSSGHTCSFHAFDIWWCSRLCVTRW